jgi:adenine C2-methylase RlmN of 23S rRNA A2503 and tRNA A37
MFIQVLEQAGINVTLRASKGGEIEAACGQLRRRHVKVVRDSEAEQR